MTEIIKTSSPEKGILQITLNRPEQLNALSHEVLAGLSRIFQHVKEDAAIKAVLLSGEGKGFCAGADIKELLPLNAETGLQFARFGQQVFKQLEELGKPSLAAIHGFAFGGGCELVMAATMRIAANNTVFGQPEIKLGVIPGFGGTQRLPRLIGQGRALDICLSGKRFTTEQALNWGFLSEITTPENLHSRAIAILKELTVLSSSAMQAVITSIYQGMDLMPDQGMEVEAKQFAFTCSTADKIEGVNAFLEKRPAVFG